MQDPTFPATPAFDPSSHPPVSAPLPTVVASEAATPPVTSPATGAQSLSHSVQSAPIQSAPVQTVTMPAPLPVAPAPVALAPVPVAPIYNPQFAPPQPDEPLAREAPRGNGMHPVLAMLLGGVLSCGLVGLGMTLQKRAQNPSNSQMQTAGGALPMVNDKSGNAIVNAVRRVGPAVMNVDTTFGKGGTSEFLPEPGQGTMPRRGKGTGVVIDTKKGLMLTNAHVVAGAQNLQVTTRDGKQYTGKVLGFDRLNDIAVVRLNSDKLPSARLAAYKNARELAIGQWTIAIGNPYAQANTVTVGVLSAVGRTIPVPDEEGGASRSELKDMIQTDTAINPGNSGGPLCNIQGEVIGINTAIIPLAQGLGYSIPINRAKEVADRIIANNGQNAYLGVVMKPITEAVRQDFGIPDRKGTFVASVAPNSPASQAGIMPGDVIRRVDGRALPADEAGGQELQRVVRSKKIGSVLKLEILRNSTVKKTVNVKIGAQTPQ